MSVSDMDSLDLMGSYHETQDDLANATTAEEKAYYEERLNRINERIDEEELDAYFEESGYAPRDQVDLPQRM
jgi:hypothetical protein